MNALWLTRMCSYKRSPEALVSAKRLIGMKIERETALLKRYKHEPFIPDFSAAHALGDVFLIEARAARHFWRAFQELLPPGTGFVSRAPRAKDPVNRLLDIGYHHVTNAVRSFLNERDVPAALGLLHVARTSNSAPLAYDLVELFRADTVDAEVLRYFRLKKKPPKPDGGDIPIFLHRLNGRLERPRYLKDFRQCHAYRYYMEVQMLKFISAVNHGKPFEPLALPDRHDSRCLTQHKAMLE